MKKSKETAIRRIFHLFYLFVHILSLLLGIPLFLFSILGLVLFQNESSMRLTQLAGMIVSFIDSIVLLIPVHKTINLKKLTFMYYLLTIVTMLSAGLLLYPVYIIVFSLLLAKFMVVALRLFSLLKINGQKKAIRGLLIRGIVLIFFVALLSTKGFGFLFKAYGRKVATPSAPYVSPTPIVKPSTPPPDLGFVVPGEIVRIWKINKSDFVIIETLLKGKGGDYSTLFVHNGQKLSQVAQVTGIEWKDKSYSIGSFEEPYVSPDYNYLFIEERGYEGGFTHAFNLKEMKMLNRSAYPSYPGTMHWSPDGKCLLGELYEYGDGQALQLGENNGNGYTMYPYEQSIRTAMGMDDLSIFWLEGEQCKVFATFTAGLLVNPKGLGENIDEEIIFDMAQGPVRRNRWKALYNLQNSAKPVIPAQIYP